MIDLTNWKLTLPVPKPGSTSAMEVLKLDGYANPPWYDPKPEGITFIAPSDGATTSGSKYVRSELREMKGTALAAWLASEGAFLAAVIRVNELPTVIKRESDDIATVVVMQAHGPDDEMCRVHYVEGGRVYFVDDKYGTEQKETKVSLRSASGEEPIIPLGDDFALSIRADAETMVVSLHHKGTTYTGTDKLGPFWDRNKNYFKLGAYNQAGKEGSKAGTWGKGRASVTVKQTVGPFHGKDVPATFDLSNMATTPSPNPEPQPEPIPEDVSGLRLNGKPIKIELRPVAVFADGKTEILP